MPKYRENNSDKKLRNWFVNDNSRALLRRIILREGSLRGLTSLDMAIDYPILAIAGRNGAGKSTILALACCAFHNRKTGFKPPKRKNPYYTLSDFFVQHAEEVPPGGIDIRYGIAHDKWKKTAHLPEGVGVGFQRRHKRKGGKWNDYNTRVPRNVVFLGIDRIVPHSERSQSRSYSRAFKDAAPKGWEDKVKDAVGYVLAKNYDKFRYLEYSKYSLPIVQVGTTTYSGFNMGAGENALFEIFSVLYSCGTGALLVIDEIELGLHAEAQRRFVERLKQVCLETQTQVVCTTHSKQIFDCLPNDARVFVECIQGKTKLTEGISSEFAFSKLSAEPSTEAVVLVEDDVAKTVLTCVLPSTLRARVRVQVIGSATALARQLAAIYVRGEERPTLACFDGDQRPKANDNLAHAKAMCETPKADFDAWYATRCVYLPSETWPEAWIIQKAKECAEAVATALSAEQNELLDVLEYGLQAGKHREFYEISKQLGLDRSMCQQIVVMAVVKGFPELFEDLVKVVSQCVDG